MSDFFICWTVTYLLFYFRNVYFDDISENIHSDMEQVSRFWKQAKSPKIIYKEYEGNSGIWRMFVLAECFSN